jgi:bacterioferritin-associated ferredoxin
MIVCICRAVSDRQIDRAVAEGATSVEAVSASTGACTGCGACHQAIERQVHQAAGGGTHQLARGVAPSTEGSRR